MHDQATTVRTVPRSERQVATNILKGSLGNMVEWFDWYVYASFAIYFSAAFFPAGNQTAELLATAGVFAIGFFMRPLGSFVMGAFRRSKGAPGRPHPLGDHHGRWFLSHCPNAHVRPNRDLVTSHPGLDPVDPGAFLRW